MKQLIYSMFCFCFVVVIKLLQTDYKRFMNYTNHYNSDYMMKLRHIGANLLEDKEFEHELNERIDSLSRLCTTPTTTQPPPPPKPSPSSLTQTQLLLHKRIKSSPSSTKLSNNINNNNIKLIARRENVPPR